VLSSRPSDPSSRNDLCFTVDAQPVSSLVCSLSTSFIEESKCVEAEWNVPPRRHLNKLLFANNFGFSTRPANDPSYLRSLDGPRGCSSSLPGRGLQIQRPAAWLHEAPLVDDLQLAYLHDLFSQQLHNLDLPYFKAPLDTPRSWQLRTGRLAM